MKKYITLDKLFPILIGSIGYGLGFFIPSLYGINLFVSIIICFVAGTILDILTNAIVYSEFIQKSNARRYMCFIIISIIFVVAWQLSLRYLSFSIINDALYDFMFLFGSIIFSFIVSFVANYIKIKKIRNKYGKGEQGYYFKKEELDEFAFENKLNSEIKGEYNHNFSVTTKYGTYVGIENNNIISFKGIPYAKAPIGDLRFMPPVCLDESCKVYEAYYFSPSEIQTKNKHNILSNHFQSEDCLYLNINTSSLDTNKKMPVVVYFHGGDGRYGGSASPFCNLDNISKKLEDVVFVSFNYRIGLFGCVDFSDKLNDYSLNDTSSLTIADQLSALNYIKENIYLFGGDPNNITLFGDSLGASYINVLCACKESKNLFKRVFMISGSYYDMSVNDECAKKLGNAIIDEFNIKNVDDLKMIPSDDFRIIYDKYYSLIEPCFINSKYIDKNISRMFKDGIAKDIDFIIGFGSGEASAWELMTNGVTKSTEYVDRYFNNLLNITNDEGKNKIYDILNFYKNTSANEKEAKYKFIEDLHFTASLVCLCNELVEGGSNVYSFCWDESYEIEKNGSNIVLILSTILGNKKIAESLAHVVSKDYTELFQKLFHKYAKGENLHLYNNELKDFKELVWKKYNDDKNILIVDDSNVYNSNNYIPENILSLIDLLERYIII